MPQLIKDRAVIDDRWTLLRQATTLADVPEGVPVIVRQAPLVNTDGTLIAVIAQGQDITKQLEVERMKNEFTSTLSHELRTPLTSIIGYLELVLEGGPPVTLGLVSLTQVREGISFVAATRWLWMALVALTFINLSYGGQIGVQTPLFVRDTLHAGAATFGAVTAAFGLGRVVGGFVLPFIAIKLIDLIVQFIPGIR